MFAISPTDSDWFKYLKDSGLNSFVNFWTPTPWNIKQLKTGDRLYFMLKSPIRKIGGFGEFVEYKNLTSINAWNEFGYRNGRKSREEFINSIQDYINKNSSKFGGQTIDINTYQIGCIVLNNCEYWDEVNFVDTEENEIDFAPQVVTIKYFDQYDPFIQAQNDTDNFDLVNEPRDGDRRRETNIRDGQGKFKGKILKAYNNKCCISGETIPELLEAAHIQEYRNRNSNHVQNGLLLRIDLHRLYDNGLLYIDENYIIHLSDLVTNEFYQQYNGNYIQLPNQENNHPSKDALLLRKSGFRN